MEEITINEINVRPQNENGHSLVIVKLRYDNGHEGDATLNTKWQKEQVTYLQNSVGVGGSVFVLIEQKGKYTNITEVDMTSGKKGKPVAQGIHDVEMEAPGHFTLTAPKATDRESSIVAQCLTKVKYRNVQEPSEKEVLDSYFWFVKHLRGEEL